MTDHDMLEATTVTVMVLLVLFIGACFAGAVGLHRLDQRIDGAERRMALCESRQGTP